MLPRLISSKISRLLPQLNYLQISESKKCSTITWHGRASLPKEAYKEALGPIDPIQEALFQPKHSLFSFAKPTKDHPTAPRSHGQTFAQYVSTDCRKLTPSKYELLILPIGHFDRNRTPNLEVLRRYSEAFFGTKVTVIDEAILSEKSEKEFFMTLHNHAHKITARYNDMTGNNQLYTKDILRMLKKMLDYYPSAFSINAVTMEDLYPDEQWNFAFGEASLADRTGVFSFARYNPMFFDFAEHGRLTAEDHHLLLRRACKVMTHELSHVFGIRHCVYYDCIMEGCNHLAETDALPMHLCPIDLRKLQYACGFDVEERYKRLLRFYENHAGFESEAEWTHKVLEQIERRRSEVLSSDYIID
jgi:archaemetzincin